MPDPTPHEPRTDDKQPEIENQTATLPTPTELEHISELLKQDTLPNTLKAHPEIPRRLLTAVRRGIAKTPCNTPPTKTLTDALLALCKPSHLAKPNPRKPSPFSNTRAAYLQKHDTDMLHRAASWASTLLTDAIRADHTTSDPRLPHIAHRDPSAVLVAPRDTLDITLAKRYATQAEACLRNPFFRSHHAALVNIQAFLAATAALSPSHAALCLPLLETAFSVFAAAPVPLLPVDHPSFEQALEHHSASVTLHDHPYALLSQHAKADLCLQSPLFYALLRRRVETVFEAGRLSYVAQRECVNPIARAAVVDVNLYWAFMDDMRALVSGTERPFSLDLWPQRRFFRAFFSETMSLMQNGNARGVGPTVIVSRFPPFGRPLIRLLLASSDSFKSQDRQRQRDTVAATANLVWKMLNIDAEILWTPNLHAFMIASEDLLEIFCWATTISFEFDPIEDRFPNRRKRKRCQNCDPLTCVSYISLLMETPRLPKGELVEKTDQLRSTAESTRKFFLNVYRKRRLDVGTREIQMRGLHAFAACGILGRTDLNVSSKSFRVVSSQDREDFSRALDKCAVWTSDKAQASRYEKYKKALEQS